MSAARRHKISLPGTPEVPDRSDVAKFAEAADLKNKNPAPAGEGGGARAALKTASTPAHAVEPSQPAARKRGRPPTGRNAKNVSFRLTPTDIAMMEQTAARLIEAGESPLRISNTLLVRVALRIMERADDELLAQMLTEAREN